MYYILLGNFPTLILWQRGCNTVVKEHHSGSSIKLKKELA